EIVVGRARRRAAVAVAELLQELLRVLATGAGQAPREVTPPADEHVRRDRGDDPHGVDAAAVQLTLHDDLGVEVAQLRTHHRQRMPVSGMARAYDYEVGGFAPRRRGCRD